MNFKTLPSVKFRNNAMVVADKRLLNLTIDNHNTELMNFKLDKIILLKGCFKLISFTN